MGLEFVEVMLLIEDEFGSGINSDNLSERMNVRERHDLTAGDLLDLILNHPVCRKCEYDLRAHNPGDNCPECGTLYGQPAPEAWATL